MPFGFGPRNCVGMRFAMMEAKMALLTVMRKFKLEKAPDTEVRYFCSSTQLTFFLQIPLKKKLGLTLTALNGIHLKVVPRK